MNAPNQIANSRYACLACFLMVSVVLAPQAVAETTNVPAGMHRFSVCLGKVDASCDDNWVRLANYSFRGSNEVWQSYWDWSQRKRVRRAYTDVLAEGTKAPECIVRTGAGYEKSTAPNKLHGTYKVTGTVLRIDWDSEGEWEEWDISVPLSGKLAQITFRASSFGGTDGWGYGSNAEWTTRVELAQLLSDEYADLDLRYDYRLWKTIAAADAPHVDQPSSPLPYSLKQYVLCTNQMCMAFVIKAGPCRIKGTQKSDNLNFYLSLPTPKETGRRNTWEHWCQFHADDREESCYTGGSHVKPLIQIIDNDGRFHGWVGVEASISQTVPERRADDLGVFVISDVLTASE